MRNWFSAVPWTERPEHQESLDRLNAIGRELWERRDENDLAWHDQLANSAEREYAEYSEAQKSIDDKIDRLVRLDSLLIGALLAARTFAVNAKSANLWIVTLLAGAGALTLIVATFLLVWGTRIREKPIRATLENLVDRLENAADPKVALALSLRHASIGMELVGSELARWHFVGIVMTGVGMAILAATVLLV